MDIPSRSVESPDTLACTFQYCPGCTTEDREFCSVSEPMLLIWQHILPLATHTACRPMRELGLVMDTRRGLNNVNRAFHFIDRPKKRMKTSETRNRKARRSESVLTRAAQRRSAQLGRGLLSLESRESITFVCIGDAPRYTRSMQ